MSKYLDAMKNVNGLLALTDGLRELGVGLKGAFDLEKDIRLLEARKDEVRNELAQLEASSTSVTDRAKLIIADANKQAEDAKVRATAELETALSELRERLVVVNAQVAAATDEVNAKTAEAAKIVEAAYEEARRIKTGAAAEAENIRGQLRAQEAALATREARLSAAVKTVGAV